MRWAAALPGALAAGLLLELGLSQLSPQPDSFLHEYKDAQVFNRADFRGGAIETNSRGERDDRTHEAATAGSTRLLWLGDSAGFEAEVPLEQTLLRRLEKKVPGLETINCSLNGSNTPELLALYRSRCGRYRAGRVVLELSLDGAGSGDFLESDLLGPQFRLLRILWQRMKIGALAHVKWDEQGIPSLAPAARESFGPLFQAFYEPALPFYHRLNLVRFLENHGLPRPISPADGLPRDAIERERQARNPGVPAPKPIETTARALAEARSEIEKDHGTFDVLFLRRGPRSPEPLQRPDFASLREVLARQGIRFLDLTGARSPDEIVNALAERLKGPGT